mmetsp:Transcript_7881/g.25230  ORF Transcript_7881/g.25230 Transcript_7881/m.25230 type:complete len:253 (-) Transcript_7881:56-814(-)
MTARCSWLSPSNSKKQISQLYLDYHDHEWGQLYPPPSPTRSPLAPPPLSNEAIFENLVLEQAQCGLSWFTVLKKRESYRRTFLSFDLRRVAAMSDETIDGAVSADGGIIRSRRKADAHVGLARVLLGVLEEYASLFHYLLSFFESSPVHGLTKDQVRAIATVDLVSSFSPRVLTHHQRVHSTSDLPTTSVESVALAADLKARGAKYVGPTTMYALLQAMGFVNDHTEGCFLHPDYSEAQQQVNKRKRQAEDE